MYLILSCMLYKVIKWYKYIDVVQPNIYNFGNTNSILCLEERFKIPLSKNKLCINEYIG